MVPHTRVPVKTFVFPVDDEIENIVYIYKKFCLAYPITEHAILFPAFPVFKLSAFPPFPQSSSSS
jgi:hypothetical protein